MDRQFENNLPVASLELCFGLCGNSSAKVACKLQANVMRDVLGINIDQPQDNDLADDVIDEVIDDVTTVHSAADSQPESPTQPDDKAADNKQVAALIQQPLQPLSCALTAPGSVFIISVAEVVRKSTLACP